MPTYDYQCEACDHAFEEYQSITAKPIRKCPSCGQRKLVRLIGTGGGVIFKGSGFYQTDYRSAEYKKSAEAEKKTTEKSKTKDKPSKGESSPSKSAGKTSESGAADPKSEK
ncbi:MAG: zinc ribbon domain-containing protein [Planctomycetota bacterium]|nr:zinc ribbon domain-containing protein [Planctomycetota bacterium]